MVLSFSSPKFLQLLFLVVLVVVVEAVAMICVRKYHTNGNFFFFVGAVMLYTVVCYLLNCCYSYDSMGMVNCLWDGISVVLVVVVGAILFKEKLTLRTVIAAIMIALGIVAIYMPV